MRTALLRGCPCQFSESFQGDLPPMQQKELRAAGIPVDVPAVALQSVNQKGIAAFFSKQRSALSSMASTSASSTTSSSTGSSSQRIAQPLAGSELDVEEKSSPRQLICSSEQLRLHEQGAASSVLW